VRAVCVCVCVCVCSPYIIGTMNQTTSTCSPTNLQLHHNFRWVLCANHMEPVHGFLARYLRRRFADAQVRAGENRATDGGRGTPASDSVVEWIPRVWQHLNKFLETHSSSDVTIGLYVHTMQYAVSLKLNSTEAHKVCVAP